MPILDLSHPVGDLVELGHVLRVERPAGDLRQGQSATRRSASAHKTGSRKRARAWGPGWKGCPIVPGEQPIETAANGTSRVHLSPCRPSASPLSLTDTDMSRRHAAARQVPATY